MRRKKPKSPFKTDAHMWQAATLLYHKLSEKYPKLQKEFNFEWHAKYVLPFGRPPESGN